MKPNFKINQGIFVISILHIFLFIIAVTLRLNHYGVGSELSVCLDLLSDLTLLISQIYIVVILNFVAERNYIICYFTIFAIVTALSFLLVYLPRHFYTWNYVTIIVGILICLLMIGLIAISFNIKNLTLRFPFRALAIAYILLLVINSVVTLLLTVLIGHEKYFIVAKYVGFSRMLPDLGLAYIIYSAGNIFKPTEEASDIIILK